MTPENGDVEKYFKTYLDVEPVQEPALADVDPQLASIILSLIDCISRSDKGTIIDIGCGKGVLLARLVNIDHFIKANGWSYIAVDSDENLQVVQTLARHQGINRRVELCELDSFYTKWPESAAPNLIFCRNVFHELSILQTATLLSHVTSNATSFDFFLIQDLMNLNKGERHNACWFPTELETCVKAHGFGRTRWVAQGTSKGSRWFNLIADNFVPAKPKIDHERSRHIILESRHRQWATWLRIEDGKSAGDQASGRLVDIIDLDLQLAALTRQLRNEGAFDASLGSEIERRIRHSEITDRIDKYVRADHVEKGSVIERVRFRERGDSLNALESFLRSSSQSLIGVTGGAGIGKTTLIEHLLANRTYEKSPIVLDGRKIGDPFSLMEQLFAQAGLRLEPEVLSVLGNLNWPVLETSLRQFANRLSRKIILVIDNLHELLDSNGNIDNDDVETALEILTSAKDAKVILVGRFAFLPRPLQRAVSQTSLVRIGLFGTDVTVVNILDDYFDRAAARLQDYPPRLISAIDRHPLIASLVGQILKKHGPNIFDNERFFLEVEQRLRDDLWNRLVDAKTRPAVFAASQLRIATPLFLLEQLSSSESVHAALEDSVLYKLPDTRWQELVSTLGVFRVHRVENDPDQELTAESDTVDHSRIADLYWRIYREDDDPKWIRESYFHRMIAAGSSADARTLGKYYYRELLASANYCFIKRHDYRTALDLYNIAAKLDQLSEDARMHRASCLIRESNRQEGEAEYKSLFIIYPNNLGIRTSYIDALLAIGEYDSALAGLNTLGLKPERSDWITSQWGRTLLGLDRYAEAEAMFNKLLVKALPAAGTFLYAARALQYQGAVKDAIDVLTRGSRLHPNSTNISVALGINQEKIKNEVAAIDILNPIFDTHPNLTHAALPLMKISIRHGNTATARQIFDRARDYSDNPFSSTLVIAEAEILNAERRPEAAIRLLETRAEKDQHVFGMLLESYCRLASIARSPEERVSIAAKALMFEVPARFQNNIPIQINRCRLASLARDREAFDKALQGISLARTERFEVESLEQSWRHFATVHAT